ncbi:MAG: hypothetical protein ABUL77_03260 [Bacteroidota bacterium]
MIASFPKMLLASSALILTLVIAAPAARATEVGLQRRVGVGLVAGSAPGLTAKIWTSTISAVDLGLGFGLGTFACSDRFNPCGKRTSFNIDYLWQSGHGSLDVLSLHLGLGARLWFWDYGNGDGDLQVAIRAPIGLDLYAFNWLELYGELTPSLAVGPAFFYLEGALGFRIYL